MDTGLKDKVAVVTGGSRGIGRACVEALAREGAKVVLTYAGNQTAAEETVAAVRAAGGEAVAVRSDAADPAAAKALVDRIQKDFGALHVLVANAGISVDGLLMRYKDEDLQRIFATNVYGPFFLCRAAARLMMKSKYGRIILMGSVVGSMGNTGQTAYAGTKAALVGMARSMAKELASRHITANVVAPGFIETDMTSELTEDMKAQLTSQIPSGELGRGHDVAAAAVFLAGEGARYITGHVLHVNGGLAMG
ncbi:MAG TPA: 3-oxoacyl-ACP reductase family protein [Myxococcales bacterium LLY-WYZ-16_1]|nr:3-oxoacyl-ACP reductase family protein [Myxococcales bacterium LLY-WYZ-16_1]